MKEIGRWHFAMKLPLSSFRGPGLKWVPSGKYACIAVANLGGYADRSHLEGTKTEISPLYVCSQMTPL